MVDKLDQRNLPNCYPAMTFLGIEGCHAFVTGARGGIGEAIVQELLSMFSLFPYSRWSLHAKSTADLVFKL